MEQRKKSKANIAALQAELSRLRSRFMKLEGDRIELAIRHTDLLSHWKSASATHVCAVRQRDETIKRLLADSGIRPPEEAVLKDERKLRSAVLKTADKAVQTDLW